VRGVEPLAVGRLYFDTSEPGVAIVVLEGEHELFSAPKLQRQLEVLIGEGLSLVVDLASATFLDSSVVAVLLRARDSAQDAGVSFAIVVDDSTGEPVRRMFEITGLASILPVVRTRAEALPRAG
jgi:anti-sigma B factor antagonist